jgi:hypothetical protein
MHLAASQQQQQHLLAEIRCGQDLPQHSTQAAFAAQCPRSHCRLCSTHSTTTHQQHINRKGHTCSSQQSAFGQLHHHSAQQLTPSLDENRESCNCTVIILSIITLAINQQQHRRHDRCADYPAFNSRCTQSTAHTISRRTMRLQQASQPHTDWQQSNTFCSLSLIA